MIMPIEQRADAARFWSAALCALLLAGCATKPPPKPVAPPPQPPAKVQDPVAAAAKKNSQTKEPPKTAPAPTKNSAEALAPADVGYYMDVLQGRLRQVTGIDIVRREDRVVVAISGSFDLAAGHAQADAGLRPVLADLAKVLAEYRKTQVSVHPRGAEAADPLAQRCVIAAAHLLTAAGVTAKRVSVGGASASGALPANAPATFAVALEFVIEPVTLVDAR
jgi:outer membrane protein OmpA-like peptidoglycan-associated protein